MRSDGGLADTSPLAAGHAVSSTQKASDVATERSPISLLTALDVD